MLFDFRAVGRNILETAKNFLLFQRLKRRWDVDASLYWKQFRWLAFLTFLLFFFQALVYAFGKTETPVAPRGLLDLQLAWDPTNVRLILDSWSKDGRIVWARGEILVDFGCVFAYTSLLFGMCWWANTKRRTENKISFNNNVIFGSLLYIPLVAGGCNVLGNGGLLAMLVTGSQFKLPVPDVLIHFLSHFIFCVSVLKFGCIGLGVFYWLVTLPLVREVRAFGAVLWQIRFSVFFALAAPLPLSTIIRAARRYGLLRKAFPAKIPCKTSDIRLHFSLGAL